MHRSKTASLFDQLIRTGKRCRWYCEAECLSGFKIDHQIVLGRRLHRHVGRFLALEDAVDIAGGAPKPILKINSIRDQTADSGEKALEVDRGKSVASRKVDDQTALNIGQRTLARTRECRDGPLSLVGVAQVEWANVYADRPRHGLDDR